MSVENKETGNLLPNIKKMLEAGNIEMALNSFEGHSQEIVREKENELTGMYKLSEFVGNLNEEETHGIDTILSQFLTPQNLTA